MIFLQAAVSFKRINAILILFVCFFYFVDRQALSSRMEFARGGGAGIIKSMDMTILFFYF